MTSLLDIGPLTEEVSVGGDKKVNGYGITPEGFFLLFTKFPEMKDMMDKRNGGGNVSLEALRLIAPNSIATVIALATTNRGGYASNIDWAEALDATVKVASTLGVYVQAKIVNAAIRLTFPEG